uniref:Uncharacterized protein n=1 Tax=Mycena chlorophos TaxID=658473 RepID=A0ABQ0LZ13_MYCCL|nr:predicted protein [Mycena chlorophos]
MIASRAILLVLSLVALGFATPIDEKLQPVIALKNNIGFVNPPQASTTSGASSLSASLSMSAVVLGAAVALV